MSSRLESPNMKYAVLGLVSGTVFSPIGFGVAWVIAEQVRKLLELQACAQLYLINDRNLMLFSLPLLIFIGAIVGGVFTGHVAQTRSNKFEIALCATIAGAFVGTVFTELIFVGIEFGRQCYA